MKKIELIGNYRIMDQEPVMISDQSYEAIVKKFCKGKYNRSTIYRREKVVEIYAPSRNKGLFYNNLSVKVYTRNGVNIYEVRIEELGKLEKEYWID